MISRGIFRYFFVIVLALSTGLLAVAEQHTQTIHLMFTNDLLGGIKSVPARFMNPENAPMLSGGAGMYKYVQSVREKAVANDEYTLLLDGGNFYSGTVLGTYDGGATIVKWMNRMGYDAAVPGPMDFDFGTDNLRTLAQQAKYPFLSGNIRNDKTGDLADFVKPYIIKQLGEISVGIIGITGSNLADQVLPSRIDGIDVQPPLNEVRRLVREVKNEGADIVILLSSLGLPYDRQEVYERFLRRLNQKDLNWESFPLNALEIAHLVPDIDIILTGGNTAGYDHPWEDPQTHTMVIQNYGNGSGLTHLRLEVDKRTKSLLEYKTPTERSVSVTLLEDDIWPDLAMEDSIDAWASEAEATLHRDYTAQIVEIMAQPAPDSCLTTPTYEQPLRYDWDIPTVNRSDTIEVMTWNIEQFPHAGDTTIQAAAAVLRDLQPDIVGLQEIGDIGEFVRMMNLVPEYGFAISQHSSFYDQAVIYRKDVFTFLGQREFFTMDDFFFAGRPPFQVDLLWRCGDQSMQLSVVNLHLKCCGDGLYRRQRSVEQLHANLLQQMAEGNRNIVVIGDWNDELLDTGIYQSFYAFLEDTANFRFATREIVEDPAQASYPSWPSFLDHILYSRGLFDESQGGKVQTIRLDEYIGSWHSYESLISDHRPVMWSFPVK